MQLSVSALKAVVQTIPVCMVMSGLLLSGLSYAQDAWQQEEVEIALETSEPEKKANKSAEQVVSDEPVFEFNTQPKKAKHEQ